LSENQWRGSSHLLWAANSWSITFGYLLRILFDPETVGVQSFETSTNFYSGTWKRDCGFDTGMRGNGTVGSIPVCGETGLWVRYRYAGRHPRDYVARYRRRCCRTGWLVLAAAGRMLSELARCVAATYSSLRPTQ
jgi:hypothetical protein